MKKAIWTVSLFIFLASLKNSSAMSLERQSSLITVYYQTEAGPVNKDGFGSNLLAFEPSLHNRKLSAAYYGHADYGAGIWDADKNMAAVEPVTLAKNAGIKTLRFPGGCGSHLYDWKKAIGKDRQHYRFGVNEFLEVCRQIGAEPVFTISFFTGSEADAADLVEYLNALDNGSNINGGTDWARVRSENGHPKPYSVKYFEIGNEVYHGNHVDITKVTPEEYAGGYLKYYRAIKAVDSSVKAGVVLSFPGWNNRVMSIVRQDTDFGIVHFYPPQPNVSAQDLEKTDPNVLFQTALAVPMLREEHFLRVTRELLREKAGRAIPLAITEYNGGFAAKKAYLYSLGSALMNAELMRLFTEPSQEIIMVNHWNLLNEFWGSIANGFAGRPTDLYKPYYKRPAYYVHEFYYHHFGDTMVDFNLEGRNYAVSYSQVSKVLAIQGLNLSATVPPIPYLGVSVSKDKSSGKLYLMVINRNMRAAETAVVRLNGFSPQPGGTAWILNGDSVTSTNENSHNSVGIRQAGFTIRNGEFNFTFQPHSLTAIEIEKAS